MNLLAFDTSTDVMSVAVQRTRDGTPQVWQQTALGGAQTSTNLIPVIQQLMAQADLRFDQLNAIVLGRGPGSFTGLRTACSVAQGLALGAKVPVLPVDTLLAVAEDARCQCVDPLRARQVTALLDALALWARGQGAEWLWLEVRFGNLRALHVYERQGFQRVGQRKNYYPNGQGQREHALVMSLRL